MVMEELRAARRENTVVLFDVAGQQFGLLVVFVREILPMATLSRPPALPSILEGFLNLEGMAIPVVRMDILFGLAKQSLESYSVLIILRGTELPVALLVQRVIGIVTAPS